MSPKLPGGNILYYGDNLDVLRLHVPDESVDLVYLDPPFKSDQNYNVLFAEKDGTQSAAQIQAFEDTWHWDQEAAATYQEIVELGGAVSQVMQAFRAFLGENDMMAYLAMMSLRIVELQRVLKSTGSIYLHCDSTASHYLKLLLDAVFGHKHFRNEIVWRRSDPKGHAFSRFPSAQDVLLYYSKSDDPVWHTQYRAYDESYIKSHYSSVEAETGRRFTLSDVTNPNKNRPNLTYEWKGITKVWRWTKDKMQKMHESGRLVYTKSGSPRYKRYLDEMPGTVVTSIWDDIPFVNSQARERLGYPTQKPEALLERIIQASSNEGDTVLDPFCGCGTTIAVAERLKRRWIGIDVTHLAISLMKHRLVTAFEDSAKFTVVGEPTVSSGAEELAKNDPYQFQWWALGLVGARPVEQKKGADRGIDGRLYFHDEGPTGKTKQIIFSVKAGKTSVAHLRDLRGVVDREKAAMGVLLTLQEPTKPMRREAASAGFYESGWNTKHPVLQVVTVGELLDGKRVDMPPVKQVNVTFKRAPKSKVRATENLQLFQMGPGDDEETED